ncbi:glycosyltransferase family 2 protein [Croceibacter atlanticus]|uniref:glycosyltransferase family 2 protein n=1 Tax=Croceibacter atlanticus TaxID=313588 RepID=UPI0030DA1520
MNYFVSIIIPTYNRAHLIEKTLDCVIAQTYTNWECIIVDDGSTDNTAQVLKKYTQEDKRFQYHHRPKDLTKGANACRNYGFELSVGQYINWLDSDDIMAPNKIEIQIELIKGSNFNLATCKWGFFNDEQSNIYLNLKSYNTFECIETFFLALKESKGYFPLHSYLMSKQIIKMTNGWNENLCINQDAEYISRLIKNVESIKFADNTNVLYRIADNTNTSSFNSIVKANEAIKSWKLITENLNGIGVPYTIKMKDFLFKKLLKTFPFLIFSNLFFF